MAAINNNFSANVRLSGEGGYGAGGRHGEATGARGQMLDTPRRDFEFNPVSLFLAVCDTALAHNTILLLSDSEWVALAVGLGTGILLFVLPQLAANDFHGAARKGRGLQMMAAVPMLGVYGIVVTLLFGVRASIAGVSQTSSYLGDVATTGDGSNLFMAAVMAFIMIANAAVGFKFRLSVLRKHDRRRQEKLAERYSMLLAKKRAIKESPEVFAFNRERFEAQVAQEAERKKRMVETLHQIYRDELAQHAIGLFEDQDDTHEFLSRLIGGGVQSGGSRKDHSDEQGEA